MIIKSAKKIYYNYFFDTYRLDDKIKEMQEAYK